MREALNHQSNQCRQRVNMNYAENKIQKETIAAWLATRNFTVFGTLKFTDGHDMLNEKGEKLLRKFLNTLDRIYLGSNLINAGHRGGLSALSLSIQVRALITFTITLLPVQQEILIFFARQQDVFGMKQAHLRWVLKIRLLTKYEIRTTLPIIVCMNIGCTALTHWCCPQPINQRLRPT